jgi:hypothetical protein
MVKHKTKPRSKKKTDWEFYAQIALVIILAGLLIYSYSPKNGTGIGIVSASSIVPTGVPPVYGEELGITYEDVSPYNQQRANEVINLLGNIDRVEKFESQAQLDRYIDILYNMHNGISCEYCCGARSIIFENGQPACGCAHSYAMRGLTKYMIKYHPEISDEEILTEIGKWKILFFPGTLEQKAQIMESQGIDVNYISLTTNQYRGIEQGQTSGGMVGGC